MNYTKAEQIIGKVLIVDEQSKYNIVHPHKVGSEFSLQFPESLNLVNYSYDMGYFNSLYTKGSGK